MIESTARNSGRTETPEPPRPIQGFDLRAVFQWITRAGAVASIAGLLFNLGLFIQTGAWQMLFVCGGMAVTLTLIYPIFRAAGKGEYARAGILSVLVTAIPFTWVELAQSGISLYLVPAGLIAILGVSRLALGRKWMIGIPVAALYAGAAGIINWLEPLPRSDLSQLGAGTRLSVLLTFTFIAVIILSRLAYAYQRIVSIRVRLIIGFVAVALLPAVATIGLVLILGSQTGSMFPWIAGVGLGSVVLAVAVSLLITQSITGPLARLRETSAQIAGGDLTLTAEVAQQDEIGLVALAFNRMTGQMRALIAGLEERVAQRTAELERHAALLEASSEVAYAASSILDPDALIRQVVDLIRDRFGLYYVGLFLLDQARENVVLRAGTGDAGRAMLARGHRLRIGEGMVGWSVAHAEWRVAAEVGDDAVRLATAELPGTRAEAALPLRSRGQVLGALTVQDTRPGAFDQDMMITLQTMADQVALALDNARLLVESQRMLEAERRAYTGITLEAWARLLRSRTGWSYRCDLGGITVPSGPRDSETEQAIGDGRVVLSSDGTVPTAAVPIRIREQVIGALHFRKANHRPWTREEVALLSALSDQLGLALDSARLYADSRRRAAHEEAVRRVTGEMRRGLDIESVLQTTVAEVGRVLGVPRAYVRLGFEAKPGTDDQGLTQ